MLVFGNWLLQNPDTLLDVSRRNLRPSESTSELAEFSSSANWVIDPCLSAANWYKPIVLKKANLLKSRDAKLPVYRYYLRQRGCQIRDIDVSHVLLALSFGRSSHNYLRSETMQHCCNVPAHAGCNSANEHNVCSVGDERFVR